MVIEVTFDVTDVYISTTVSPVYVNVSFEAPSGGGGTWGSITGTLSNQTDLQNALNAKFDDPTGTTAQYLRGDGSLATFPSLTGYVPYTGATTNVDLGEYQLRAGQLTLDTSPTGTAAVGTTRWNDTIGSSETILKGGSVILKNGVDLVARVVNKVTPNTTLTKAAYQAVRVSGAQGQRLAVALAQANNDANSADTIGLVTETIATNQEGFIITVGQIENINTTGSLQGETWADGDVLYLSPTTAGAITKVKPTGNGHIVVIGYVEYAHANNGKIYVKVMNGWELDELHDVSITSVANNDALIYESATTLWKNKSIATALGYTPANAATTLTINGVTFDLSTSRTFTVGSVTGSGASGQVAYWDGTTSQAGSNNLFWDNANGRLGIGTATPSILLHVRGSYAGALDSSIPQMLFENANTTAGADIFALSRIRIGNGYLAGLPEIWLQAYRSAAGVGSINLRVVSNHALLFSTNDAERMRIFAGGNVGIGTGATDSGQRLQVQGTTLLNGNVTFSSATGMFWDAANSRLGIGTNAPTNDLSISKTVDGVVRVGITNLSTGTNAFSGLAISNSVGAVALQLTGTGNTLVTPNQARLTTGSTITNGFTIETGTTAPITIGTSNTIGMTMFGSTRNVVLQNGGTFTDSGERLQVTGTMKVTAGIGIGSPTLSSTTIFDSVLSSSSDLLARFWNNGTGGMKLRFVTDNISATCQHQWTTNVFLSAIAANNTIGLDFRVGLNATEADLNASSRMRILTNGNILIGTTTDSGERLQVTGTMKVTGASSFGGDMTLTLNQNAVTGFTIINNNAGAAAASYFRARTTNNATYFDFVKVSNTATVYKIIAPNDALLYNAGSAGDIAILNDWSSGNIKFAAGGSSTAQMTIKSNGRINMSSLPTSPTGLSSGDLWNNLGMINIV